MRKKARVDRNHAEIVDALRKRGYMILSLAALGSGVPDLLAFHPGLGDFVLIEVKTKEGKLTRDQERFIADGWPVLIVRSVDDALNL